MEELERTMEELEEEEPRVEAEKCQEYVLDVDRSQDDKAKEILLCNFSRPHMRAFHCAWWAFFVAFFVWFSIAPLLSEIQETLGLTKEEIWTSSIVGVSGTILMRFLLGAACDKYGARVPFAATLCVSAIPTALTGLVNDATGLVVLRLFVGIAGGTFVTCQFWTSSMFTREVVATANALVAGWGNLGGGVTQVVVGSIFFPLFKVIFGGDAEMAWRTVCVVPALLAMATGVTIYFISDDAPRGNFREMKRSGKMLDHSAATFFRRGLINANTWVLFVQYACCFGVELTMNNGAALYFKDEFGQSTESAAAIASAFGWMNLFFRGMGGFASDKMNAKMGMRGRLLVQIILLLMEGMFVLVLARSKSLSGSIFCMLAFSIFVQAAEGSTYGIVPYVDSSSTGSIAGIVGAGGSVGAVGFSFGFRQMSYYGAFNVMGWIILGSAILTSFLSISGHRSLFFGDDSARIRSSLPSPAPVLELTNDPDGEKVVCGQCFGEDPARIWSPEPEMESANSDVEGDEDFIFGEDDARRQNSSRAPEPDLGGADDLDRDEENVEDAYGEEV